jgi:type VI secretion system protein ImpK
MGFSGRYIHEDDDFLLEQLKTSNLKVLTGSSVGLPALDQGELFAEAYPRQPLQLKPQQHEWNFSPIILLGIGSPVVLYVVLFLIYRFILNNISENLLSTVL